MRHRQSYWLGGCLSQPCNQAATPARLLSFDSSPHVPVNGGGDVMDEPRVPLLVRLKVCGQRMTVGALLRGGGLVLGLLHSAAPPRKNVGSARLSCGQTISGTRRCATANSKSHWSSTSAFASWLPVALILSNWSLFRSIASALSKVAAATPRPDARSTSRLALQNPSSSSRAGRRVVL